MFPKVLASRAIKEAALQLGFDACGISTATFLENEARQLEQFLSENRHGKMDWLGNHFEKRVDPRKLMPGTRSVISVLANYQPEINNSPELNVPKISQYAWGPDYHSVLKAQLKKLIEILREQFGQVEARCFVDSAPVMDKVWAARSGLGWIGKNTNLIRKGEGSWYFIGEILTDLALEPDGPVTDHCGSCTKCIDACPTQALSPYQIDASQCISYLTIELKEQIPEPLQNQLEGWAFGCDICQQVCPWNSFGLAHTTGWFTPLDGRHQDISFLSEEISDAEWKNSVKGTPLSRIKPEKWRENIRLAKRYFDSEEG
ncbi:MAG: tRNA epoxyqueuosine(34) reductase QueG [Sphingobacteriia bacterium]|nr:tRNA epoxyqueuosine(34) reductase QueG [Sphingobacteriia bacterium]